MPYQEYPPPAQLASHVECFWTSHSASTRVLPDACQDIIYQRGSLIAVGALTRAQVFNGADTVWGIRFHPGMSRLYLKTPGHLLTDSAIELSHLWGSRGRQLERRLSDESKFVELLSEALEPISETPCQRMLRWVTQQGGRVKMDDLAGHAGLSTRHLRRVFLEQTGLSPKMFCRVVRFRALVHHVVGSKNWAGLALDHGYYDQSHLANEFKELSGITMADFSKTLGARAG